MPSLRDWWTGDTTDPGRLPPEDPRVRDLLDRIAPGETIEDLGGAFSLNLRLTPSDRVLRVHRPMISRRRLRAEQHLRAMLCEAGIRTPLPFPIVGDTIALCGHGSSQRLAELEPFVRTTEPAPSIASSRWLFHALGSLHTVASTLSLTMPRAVVATWGTPSSMSRWLAETSRAVASAPAAREQLDAAWEMLPAIRSDWVDPSRLPHHLVHGDFRLGNAVQAHDDGELVVFDMGFAAVRPRVWDVAYALGFVHLALGEAWGPATTDEMIALYEDACSRPLNADERRAIPAMAAIALLHTLAHAGFMANPTHVAGTQGPFVRAARRILWP